jgi:hypothetical protein
MANLFGKKTTATLSVVGHHQKASDSAFKVFSDTLEKLLDANVEIEIDITAQQNTIAQAKDRENALIAIRDKNANLNAKISKFFES